MDELVSLFAKNVDWDIPGNSAQIPWLGARSKKSEIKSFYELLWLSTEPLGASITKILWEEKHAVVVGEFETRMTATNNVVESFFCIYIEVENGLISKYRLLEDSFAVSEAMAAHYPQIAS